LFFFNYQLPNGLIKVRRRWGQRHPQGANSGSNGKLKLMLNSKQLPPAHPYPMLANVYQASPLFFFKLILQADDDTPLNTDIPGAAAYADIFT
jgi:hypothetical protein